ncbi:DUF4810 domain-containing protein [Granulosicoccus sp. 3-233]|uniref:DUF4810 domain-containing protein n=1 Tax=Granulosicoccus sp. 3-233 TaxID=3417969 RepID=UPI003D34C803
MRKTSPVRTRLQLAGTSLLLVMFLSGCVTPEPPLYRWGNYEELIYNGYKNPGSSDPVNDALALEEDLRRTEAEGMQIPPGVRIHLAYLYVEQGKTGEARALLESERERFPESAAFVERLMASMEHGQ